MKRCPWSLSEKIYLKYHDEEWGVPIFNDNKIFEYLILEGAQAGLSWLTILKRRNNYRKAYDDFDFYKIAKYDDEKRKKLLENEGIIRNKLKINSSINNAKRAIEVKKEFGSLSKYFWSFTDFKPIINRWETIDEVPAESKISKLLAKDLKKRGFKFVGSITIYAFMQAIGMVNDHLTTCFRYKEIINNYPSYFKSIEYMKYKKKNMI